MPGPNSLWPIQVFRYYAKESVFLYGECSLTKSIDLVQTFVFILLSETKYSHDKAELQTVNVFQKYENR